MNDEKAASEIIQYQQRIYNGGYSTSSGGNVSLHVGNTVYITPTGKDKGDLKVSDISAFVLESMKVISDSKPSCEMMMHAEIYRCRPEIKAIIHAHPTYTTVMDLLSVPLETDILSESYIFIPRVAYVNYAMPSSLELASLVADHSKEADVLILANHGIVVCGTTLEECFQKLEVAEEIARVQYLMMGKGPYKRLSAEQREEIDLSFHS